jgi:hypothetical protein
MLYTSDPKSREGDPQMNRLIAKIVGRPNGNGGGSLSTQTQQRRVSYVVTKAESAPCTCPDFCERDHEND